MVERSGDTAGDTRSTTAGGSAGPRTSRRAFIATGAALSGLALAGCLGGSDSGGGGGGDGPEPPWTTRELADHIDDGSTVTIYAGTGDSQQWYDLIEVINDEFGTNIEGNVFASDGGKVSQRFFQERQAGSDKADLLTNASDIQDEIKLNGKEAAEPYFEWDMDENFWFNDVLPDEEQLPFMVGAYNGGAGTCMPLNEDVFEERGLDYPTTYNDLFDDQYEGLEALFPGYIVGSEVGWIVEHHAAKTDLSNEEWISTLADHLNFVGASSHTGAAREVAKGNSPMMFYNFPWVAAPFAKNDDYAFRGHFVDPVKSVALAGPLSINEKAPHPWVARFFVSAVLEEPVQRRMIHDVTDQIPARLDLDYAAQDPHPFTRRRLTTDLQKIGFMESAKYSEVGQRLKDSGAFGL